LPVLLVTMLASVDLGRLIYSYQVLTDLTREAANLVSRGGTLEEAFAATMVAEQNFSIETNGGMVISRARRQSATSAKPWVVEQQTRGGVNGMQSRVGKLNGAATIPNVTDLPAGVTVTAVEIMHSFEPVFPLAALGLDFYPTVLYDAAFF
jgi:Flp pilus assembly protein TadG